MPSSISSSRRGARSTLIARTIVWTLALSVGWIILIEVWQPGFGQPPTQIESNRVRAERFLFSATAYETVLVGSSQTQRLPDEALPEKTYNLSFGAGTSLHGLALLRQSGRIPERVIVETASLAYPYRDDLLDSGSHPALQSLRERFRAFRAEYRPIVLLYGAVYALLSNQEPPRKRYAAPVADSLPEAIVRIAVQPYEDPAEERIGDHLDQLDQEIAFLRKQACEIVFLKLPMHERIEASPQIQRLRAHLHERFPPTEYPYWDLGPCSGYATTDGIHLTDGAAWTFARRLSDRIETAARSPAQSTNHRTCHDGPL